MIRPWPSLRSQLPVLSWPSKPWGASLLSIRTSKWQPARRPGLLVKRIAVQAFVGLEIMLFRMVFHGKRSIFLKDGPKILWLTFNVHGNSHDFGEKPQPPVYMKKTGGKKDLGRDGKGRLKKNTVHLSGEAVSPCSKVDRFLHKSWQPCPVDSAQVLIFERLYQLSRDYGRGMLHGVCWICWVDTVHCLIICLGLSLAKTIN